MSSAVSSFAHAMASGVRDGLVLADRPIEHDALLGILGGALSAARPMPTASIAVSTRSGFNESSRW
jgi:hypothetical protein